MSQQGSSIELTRTLRRVKVPSFIAASDGTITWENEAAEKMFGDLRQRPFATVVAPEDVPLVQRQLERKLRGATLTDYEVEVFTADGRRRRAEISSVPIENGDDCHAVFGVVLPGKPRDPAVRMPQLTARQNEVLQVLAEGASTEQIAAMLHVSKETVRNHIRPYSARSGRTHVSRRWRRRIEAGSCVTTDRVSVLEPVVEREPCGQRREVA